MRKLYKGGTLYGMNQVPVRERVKPRQDLKVEPSMPRKYGVLRFEEPQTKPKRQVMQSMRPVQRVVKRRPVQAAAPTAQPVRRVPNQRIDKVTHNLINHQHDERFQHELQEMQETDDLRKIDDDVEDVATLYEWHAVEHNHQPKSAKWFAVLAAGITVVSLGLLLLGNFIGAITIALLGGFTYYVAQRDPAVVRYRIMTEGIAFNNLLYHYRDLDAFNIVYEPGHTKTVIIKSNRPFSPLLHMEIGDADPVAIRDLLIEFVQEDQNMLEPITDIWARRLGF